MRCDRPGPRFQRPPTCAEKRMSSNAAGNNRSIDFIVELISSEPALKVAIFLNRQPAIHENDFLFSVKS